MPAASRDDSVQSSKLAENQQSIWYDQLARPQSAVYNIGGRLVIYGEVDYGCMKQAIQHLVSENDALRLHVVQSNGQTLQIVRPKLIVDLPFIDFSNAHDPDAAANEWLQNNFNQAFQINDDSIYWQFALIKISSRQYALLTKYHHLIADGWTTKIVIDRLAELYNALLSKTELALPEAASYLDFVEQERQYLNSSLYERDAEFWQKALPVLPEPLIRHKYHATRDLTSTSAHIHRCFLTRAFYERLSQYAAESQSTTYHLLLSALCLYFARAHQQQQVTVGIPALNRSGARFKKVLGMFASLSPLAIDVDISSNPRQLLRQFTVAIRHLHKHQRYPLSAINHRLQLLKNKRESLFDLVLSYERQDYSVRFGDANVHARQLFSGNAVYPLAVTVCEFNADDDVELIFEGAETCFNVEELDWLARRLQFVLQQIIDSPDSPLRDIDLVPPAEKRFIFDQFKPRQDLPEFISVIHQFHACVMRTPDAMAISQQGRSLTYRQLHRQSNQLAHELQQRHCSAGDIVAVCMPRCIEAIIGLLAILKIRGVYLPIDIDSPKQRIENIVRQSRAVAFLIVTASKHLNGLHGNSVWVDQIKSPSDWDDAQYTEPQADDIAYLLYTSGSSGQPKGVKIHHQALSLRMAWLQKAFNLKSSDRVGQTIQTHFDPSMIEIFLALTQGACLVLAPWQRMTAELFAEFVLTQNINALALVPSSVRLLLQGFPASGSLPLRVACCGGETLPASLAKAFIDRTGAKLLNVYGPTETTILASAWTCTVEDEDPLPIGRPLDYAQILIVDRDLKLLPLAVPGEIVIGGAGVGKGYLGEALMTSQAFVPNPFSGGVNESLYRSGDCGYIGTDGLLYFAERLDRQVKISGYRIEPAEIESVLIQHPAVQQAAVNVVVNDQKLLVAYVEAAVDKVEALKNELSAYLRQRLPDYMQPRAIIVMDRLPLTPIGKIAYARLPAPSFCSQSGVKRPPATALESQLLVVWQRTLKNSQIGVEDNFFEQDSDSLTAISLLVAIESLCGHRQSIAWLIAYPTVAMQAEQLTQAQAPTVQAGFSTLSKQRDSVHLYLAASGYGDQLRFQALADALGGGCTVHMLYPPPLALEQASIEAIASEYARVIMQNPQHKFYLGGFSIAGVTALETARVLEQQGHAPIRLILLDSVYPRWPLQSPWLFKILQWLSGLLILNQISLNGRKLQAMLTDPGIIVQLVGLNRHRIQTYQGATLLVMSNQMRWLRSWLFSGWYKLLGDRLQIDHVPGLHGAMFRPKNLPELSQVIKRCLVGSR